MFLTKEQLTGPKGEGRRFVPILASGFTQLKGEVLESCNVVTAAIATDHFSSSGAGAN